MEEKKKKFRFQYHQAVSSHNNTELLPTWLYIQVFFFFFLNLIQLLYFGISLLQRTNLYPTSYILCLMNPQNPNIRLRFHISE